MFTQASLTRVFVATAMIILTLTNPGVASEIRDLTVLVSSGTSGRLVDPESSHTIATLAATIQHEADTARSQGRDVVVLDAGRTLAPYAESRHDGGVTMMHALSAIGCQAFAPSPLDFSIGIERLLAHQESSKIPFSLPYRLNDAAEGHSALIDLGGGLMLEVVNLFDQSLLGDLVVAGINEPDLITAENQKPTDALRIAVVHSAGAGSSMLSRNLTWGLVENAPDIDLVFDPDLEHEITLRRETESTPLFLVGRPETKGEPWTFSRIDLTLERANGDWSINSAELSIHTVNHQLQSDPQLETLVLASWDEFKKHLNKPLRPEAPTQRADLERFVLDSMTEIAHAEIALLNRGALRPVRDELMQQRPLTQEAVVRMLSIDQGIVVGELSGKQLAEIAALSATRTGPDGLPAKDSLVTAGLEFTVDSGEAKNLTVNGRPLYMGDTYRVVTNDYLASGGDDYPVLKELAGSAVTDGQKPLELRDEIVLPRLAAADRPFIDLAKQPLWRYGVDRFSLFLDSISTDHDEAYEDARDSRARADDSSSIRADVRLWADREMPSWRLENALSARFGLLETKDGGRQERDDDLVLQSAAVFTDVSVFGGGKPFADLKLDSEIRPNESNGERADRQFEQTIGAGLSWSTTHWPRLRIAAVGRHYSNVDRDEQIGVTGEAWFALESRSWWPDLELRMLGERLRGGDTTVQRFDFDLRLKLAITGRLFVTSAFNYYIYDDSLFPGQAKYGRFSLGLTYSWSGKHQSW